MDLSRSVGGLRRAVWRHWKAIIAVALAGGAAGWLVVLIAVPPTYRATIKLQVRLDLGGINTNNSFDASGDSIRIAEPSMLRAASQSLHGVALRDRAALYRLKCGRDPADTYVICSTTSHDRPAGRAILNQLVATFIPINVESQVGNFRSLIRDSNAQSRELARLDSRLASRVRALKAHGAMPARSRSLREMQARLTANRDVRRQIRVHVGALRRQIDAVGNTLHVLGGGATTTTESRSGTFAAGAGLGVTVALLLALLGCVVSAQGSGDSMEERNEDADRKRPLNRVEEAGSSYQNLG